MRKSRFDCIVLKGTDCVSEMIDHVLEFKDEAKETVTKL